MAGRRRSFDREQALLTAMECFWRDGYEETTVSRLTSAIGVAPPSLYAAFGDKDALFHATAEIYFSGVARNVDDALARPVVREAIGELFRISADAYADPATPPGCFLMSEPKLAAQRARLQQRVADRIEHARIVGDLPTETDAVAIAHFVLSVTAGMSQRARDGATGEDLAKIAEVALRALGDSGTRADTLQGCRLE